MAPRRDNLKAVEARERKAQVAQSKKEAELAAKEAAKWKDSGTKIQRQKDERRAEAERKADEAKKRREEKAALEKAELAAIGGHKGARGGQPVKKKLTQYEILQRQLLQVETQKRLQSSSAIDTWSDFSETLPTPNVNHQRREEAFNALLAGDTLIDASGIDAALEQLESAECPGKMDFHPERRARIAYKAFEERELERMKEEFPGLKRSQLIERIMKLWQKSSENPLVKE